MLFIKTLLFIFYLVIKTIIYFINLLLNLKLFNFIHKLHYFILLILIEILIHVIIRFKLNLNIWQLLYNKIPILFLNKFFNGQFLKIFELLKKNHKFLMIIYLVIIKGEFLDQNFVLSFAPGHQHLSKIGTNIAVRNL